MPLNVHGKWQSTEPLPQNKATILRAIWCFYLKLPPIKSHNWATGGAILWSESLLYMKRKLLISSNSKVINSLFSYDSELLVAQTQNSIHEITSAIPVQVILYDHEMGPKLLDFLRYSYPKTPLILLVDSLFDDFDEAQADYFLVKPVSDIVFANAIATLIKDRAQVR